jgi:hypothetical protein
MIENISYFPMVGAMPVPVDALLLIDFILRRSSPPQLTVFSDPTFSERHKSRRRTGAGSEMSAE